MAINAIWFAIAIISLVGGAGAFWVLMGRLRVPPVHDFNELMAFVRSTSNTEIEKLFDHSGEEQWRAELSRREFQHQQRVRMYRLYEILLQRRHNQELIGGFAFTEWWKFRKPQNEEEAVRAMAADAAVRAAMHAHHYTTAALFTLRIWLFFGAEKWWFFKPEIHKLREAAGINGLKAYDFVTSSIGALCITYGAEWHEALQAKLYGAVPVP